MTTYAFKPGASGPFVVQFADDADNPITDGAAEVRIQAGSVCIPVEGTVSGDAWEFDLSTIGLPPRLYSAAIYHDAGDGWRLTDTINLHILGGC